MLDYIVHATTLNQLLTLSFACHNALFDDIFPGTLEFDRGRSQQQRLRLPRLLQAGNPRLD